MTADLPQLMFVAGAPASGKTHFGDWLHTEHGAVHLNLDDRELRESLAGKGLARGDLAPLAATLRADAAMTVVSWVSCVRSVDPACFREGGLRTMVVRGTRGRSASGIPGPWHRCSVGLQLTDGRDSSSASGDARGLRTKHHRNPLRDRRAACSSRDPATNDRDTLATLML